MNRFTKFEKWMIGKRVTEFSTGDVGVITKGPSSGPKTIVWVLWDGTDILTAGEYYIRLDKVTFDSKEVPGYVEPITNENIHSAIYDFNQGVEAAACFLEKRAGELHALKTLGGDFMARIFLGEVEEIRKLKLGSSPKKVTS